ncbi:XRE family transcriptional regulator [Defluviitalea raffinosedens]|uniref:XRE family transcriptional regulator n=1 Tax=Defluviitalea raffinosedens TaxID=1450156 RepID=UPI001FAA2055|nr:XRE family transcriptional regulator [Defluviitalea raffinosedens]
MAEIFGVTTDYLLKDNASRANSEHPIKESVETVKKLPTVSMEEASEFLRIEEKNAPLIALGVSLCILSPILLILLFGFSSSGILGISENLAGGLGITILLIMIATAVFIFISYRNREKRYDFLKTEEIDTVYGVTQIAKEKKETFEKTFNMNISIGVILCILAPIPLLISSFLTEKEYIISVMIGLLLTIITVAVNMFIRVGIINSSYDILLQTGDYTPDKKKASKVSDKLAGIYWPIVLAVYLAWSLPTNNWNVTWVVWPVAGVLYVVVVSIAKILTSEK